MVVLVVVTVVEGVAGAAEAELGAVVNIRPWAQEVKAEAEMVMAAVAGAVVSKVKEE